ncbi:hypothetical protein AB0B25_32090 [Nocardia sp. NPDC049190]|uniref:hypothetical protein n=1 Tax=Nocardia sp. NPDC049190 TaxID=3155650 RepID=UPI0033F8A9F3
MGASRLGCHTLCDGVIAGGDDAVGLGLSEPPLDLGIDDEIDERITRMATRRDQLLEQALHGKGLTAMERAQFVSRPAR